MNKKQANCFIKKILIMPERAPIVSVADKASLVVRMKTTLTLRTA